MAAQRSVTVLRGVLIVIILVLMMASRGRCGRTMNGRVFDGWASIQSMLPKGPIPPSGPSPCHNMLRASHQDQLSHPHDVICNIPWKEKKNKKRERFLFGCSFFLFISSHLENLELWGISWCDYYLFLVLGLLYLICIGKRMRILQFLVRWKEDLIVAYCAVVGW